jgi:hypothetical protein
MIITGRARPIMRKRVRNLPLAIRPRAAEKMISLRFFSLSGFDTLNRESRQILFLTIKRVEV